MKTIIITGAAHGVGHAIAQTLKGHRLLLVDNDVETLKVVARRLDADHFVCDVSNPNELELLVTYAIKVYDKIDCLINNAGLWIAGEMSELDLNNDYIDKLNNLEYIQKVINTNMFGTIALTRLIAPLMINQGYGQIINVNSQSGVKVEEEYPVYNASKTGGTAFRKAIQTDLMKANIRITDINPGLIATDFYKHAGQDLPAEVLAKGLKAQDVADVVKYVFELPPTITIPTLELIDIKEVL